MLGEVDLVKKLHGHRRYLDAYANHGLIGLRTMFAHCVHLTKRELELLGHGSSICFCASSNMFLGAGRIPLLSRYTRHRGLRIAAGSDVGAGTSGSMIEELKTLHGLQQLALEGGLRGPRDHPLTAAEMLWLITQGAHQALHLEGGNFSIGNPADLVVFRDDNLLKDRLEGVEDPRAILFALEMLANRSNIYEVRVGGEVAYQAAA